MINHFSRLPRLMAGAAAELFAFGAGKKNDHRRTGAH